MQTQKATIRIRFNNLENSIFLRVNRIKTDHRHTINSNAAKYLLNDDK